MGLRALEFYFSIQFLSWGVVTKFLSWGGLITECLSWRGVVTECGENIDREQLDTTLDDVHSAGMDWNLQENMLCLISEYCLKILTSQFQVKRTQIFRI